jgi:hypothetical protein
VLNIQTAVDCLEPLVGFNPSANTCLDELAGDLTGSNSSTYVTDESGINQDIIEAAMSEDYSDISDYLRKVRRSEIFNSLQTYINRTKELTRSRELLDNVDVVKRMNYFADRVTASGRFVGLEIKPAEGQNLASVIRNLGVQFTALNTTLNIYLYESSQLEPIQTFTLSAHNKLSSLQWFALTDWICNYKSSDGGTGQTYYLGYYENDLMGQAIDTRLYQNCCGNDWVGTYQRYVLIRGCVFENSALSGDDLPDLRQVGYTDQSFGLHLKMSVTCDITPTICENAMIFTQLIRKSIALKIWWDFYNNMRLNRKAELSRDRALPNIERLEKEIEAQLKGLQLDLTDIDKNCMPCNKNFIASATMR